MAIIGGAVMAAGLGAGIPLWVKGRRELDWMLDDYTKRYVPLFRHQRIVGAASAFVVFLEDSFLNEVFDVV